MAPARKTRASTNGTKKSEPKPVEKKVTRAANKSKEAAKPKTETKKPAGKKLAPKKTNKIAELPTPPTKKPNAKTKDTKATQNKKEATAKKPVKEVAPAKKPATKPAKKAASKKQQDEDDIEAAIANEVDSSQDGDSSEEEEEAEDKQDDFETLDSLIPFDKTYRSALAKLETQIKKGQDSRIGVVYVGRIPHKIEERDLKTYFSQFGTISHARIARNPLTGRSRHYAFIQYKSQEVADIVTETMDNHLFGGRLLKVKSVPKDKVHPMLFTGERIKQSEAYNRKKVQSKITKQKNAKLTPFVKKRIETELEKTQKAIKDSGIDYEIPKKLLEKKTDKPMIESKKSKSKN